MSQKTVGPYSLRFGDWKLESDENVIYFTRIRILDTSSVREDCDLYETHGRHERDFALNALDQEESECI